MTQATDLQAAVEKLTTDAQGIVVLAQNLKQATDTLLVAVGELQARSGQDQDLTAEVDAVNAAAANIEQAFETMTATSNEITNETTAVRGS